MINTVHPLKGFTSWVVTALMTVALGAGIVVVNHHALPASTPNAAPSSGASLPSASPAVGTSATNAAPAANAKPLVTYYKGDDSSTQGGSTSTGESASFGDD